MDSRMPAVICTASAAAPHGGHATVRAESSARESATPFSTSSPTAFSPTDAAPPSAASVAAFLAALSAAAPPTFLASCWAPSSSASVAALLPACLAAARFSTRDLIFCPDFLKML